MNPSYNPTGNRTQPVVDSGFALSAWTAWLRGTASASAKVFIGLPGGPEAAKAGFYVEDVGLEKLYASQGCNPQLAGVVVWDATAADRNRIKTEAFWHVAKILTSATVRNAKACPR